MTHFRYQLVLVFFGVSFFTGPLSTLMAQEAAASLRLSKVNSAEVETQLQQIERPYSQYFQDAYQAEGVRFQADFPMGEVTIMVSQIERLEKDLQDYLGLHGRREIVEVLIFGKEENYLRFLKKEFPDAPYDRRALFIKKRGMPGMVLIQISKGIDDDIRHEMTHAFLHACYHNIPLWLDEGLAEYFELLPAIRAYEKPYINQAKSSGPLFMSVPSLKKLEKITNVYAFGVKEYRESWCWVHFLLHHSKETHLLLATYLIDMEAQSGGVVSMEDELNKMFPKLKDEYTQHFKTWKELAATRKKENKESAVSSRNEGAAY